MVFSSEHLIGMAATLAAVAAVGVWAARRVRTAADFAVSGRRAGTPIVAGTIVGTIIGGASTVGTAQLAFTVGLSAWWFTLGAGLALAAMALFYARPLRASGLETIPQFLAAHYGPAAGPLTSLAATAGIFFSIVANIMSAVPLVTAVFAFDPLRTAGLVFVMVVVYVFFGGVWATGLVGVVKTVLIYIMLLAVGWVCWRDLGGAAGLKAAFPPFPWFSLFGRGFWVDAGCGLSLLVGTLSTQTYVQAVYAARDARAARRGAMAAAAVALPSGIPAVMAGMFMRLHHPDIAPMDALPLFIVTYLPPWLGGVALAALLLGAVGSAAGLTLGVGTMLTRDVFPRLGWARAAAGSLRLNRAVVLAVALTAALFSFGNLRSLILEWNFLSMGLRGAGVFLPLSLAVFWPGRVAKRAALWAMAAGAGVTLGWKLVFPAGLDPLFAGLAASAVCLAAGWRGNKKTGEM